jgi:hypothetical protein
MKLQASKTMAGLTIRLVVLISVLAATSCDPPRTESPPSVSDLIISWPPSLGQPGREPAYFPHERHAKKLQAEGCASCHPKAENGKLEGFLLKKSADCYAAEQCQQVYHDFCIGCHLKRGAEKKDAGPRDCGSCHRQRSWQTPPVIEMRYDYSLHQRHILALQKEISDPNEKPCQLCHHLYDEGKKRLYYRPGTESACSDCHLERDQGRNLSWRHAAHLDCLECHQRRLEKNQQAGPVDCAGCHQVEVRAKIKLLAEVPRLLRGQPDFLWMESRNKSTRLVPFDHQRHEVTSFFCTGCHHRALRPCGECHDPLGNLPQSGGVSLERALHQPESSLSCVGCHAEKAAGKMECRGCHSVAKPASKEACDACHRGPVPQKMAEASRVISKLPDSRRLLVPQSVFFPKLSLPPLPAETLLEFPADLVLDSGGTEFQATKFPHRKVVEKLYLPLAKDNLAVAFKRRPELFCSGCHHHQPEGQRPAACRTCHDNSGGQLTDRPTLIEAYHRQCLGCHQAMKLKQNCEDCHKKETGKESVK